MVRTFVMTRPNLDRYIAGWRGPVARGAAGPDRRPARPAAVAAAGSRREPLCPGDVADAGERRLCRHPLPGRSALEEADRHLLDAGGRRWPRPRASRRATSPPIACRRCWGPCWRRRPAPGPGRRCSASAPGSWPGPCWGPRFLLSTEAGIAKTDAMLCGAVTLSMAALARIYLATRAGERPPQRPHKLHVLARAGPVDPDQGADRADRRRARPC